MITCGNRASWFIAWEIFGIMRFIDQMRLADETIFANTRVSPFLWHVIDWDRVTVVVHDLMDTVADKAGSEGKKDIRKRIAVYVNSWIIRNSVRRASRVLFNSSYTRSEVEKWMKRELAQGAVISPPPSFAGKIGSCWDGYHESEQKRDLPKILVVTGMTKNKRYGDYRYFYDELKKRLGGRVKLVMYGIDLVRAEIEFQDWVEANKTLVEVKYKRSACELYRDYLKCNLVCSLSAEEGYGMPVADALGFGIPVIARRIDAYIEIREKVDAMGLLKLGQDIDECVSLATTMIGECGKEISTLDRAGKYRAFCASSEREARRELREGRRKGQ